MCIRDRFDIVVIKDQERLQRNTLDWYLFINRVVQTGKLLFMYMDGKFYSPDDALITGVRAIIAEEFSRNLSKKLHNYHDHRIEKARQGQEIALQGSGNVYGWDKKDGKYYINPEQAKVCLLYTSIKQEEKVASVVRKNGSNVTVSASFSNQTLGQGYYVRNLGLYANDPQAGEILYSISVADESTATADYMPPFNGIGVSSLMVDLVTAVSNASSVKVNVDPTAGATVCLLYTSRCV